MAKIAPKTAIFAIFGTSEVKEVIMKTLLSGIGERNVCMNTVLKSDTFTAVAKSIEIKMATEQLRDLPAVSTGETNHDINIKCCNIYDNIASMLDSYCNAGERDGERIIKIADGLEMADLEMGNDIDKEKLKWD